MTLAQAVSLAEAARRLNFAARLQGRARARGRTSGRTRARTLALPPLILVTDAERMPDPLPAAAALPRGSAVILRHYAMAGGPAARAALGRRLRRLTRARGVRLLIAGDARLARALGADGIHLAEWMVRGTAAERDTRRRKGWIVTASAHSRAAIELAARRGVDAVLVSPVFATASHPGARTLGPLGLARLARRSPLPVYALGGVTGANARRLLGSGAVGIAALGAIAAPGGPAPARTAPGATAAPPAPARDVVERRPHPL